MIRWLSRFLTKRVPASSGMLPPPVDPPSFYGDLPGATSAYDLGRLAAKDEIPLDACPDDYEGSILKHVWSLGWLNYALNHAE